MPAPRRRLIEPSRGAPSALTDDARDRMLAAIARGTPVTAAARRVGIGPSTYQRWRRRGLEVQEKVAEAEENGDEIDLHPDREAPYLEFIEQLEIAQAKSITGSVLALQRAAAGGYVTKEVTRRYRDSVTGQIVEETTVDKTAPDWRAAAFNLTHGIGRQFFTKDATKVELTGANGGAIEIAVDADNLAARVQANMQAALTAATPALDPADDDEDVHDAEIVEQ